MSGSFAISLFLLVAFVAANLPWLSDRLFMLIPLKGGKNAWWRLAEWCVWYALVGAIAYTMEKQANGTVYPQDWEFYAVTFSLFMVFAFPGFILRHELKNLWKSKP